MANSYNNTLLIVDDEKNVLRSIKRVFKKEGYHIHCIASAVEAFNSIDDINPHVILSDRRMPHMDGLDLLTRIKEKHPECYCVLMTGFPYIPESVQNALQQGHINLVVRKPFDDGAITQIIEKAFEVQRRA
jgi:DNA-binding NtrC family response regulator